MKDIEWFINPKMEKQTVHIAMHTLRFKMKTVKELELNNGDLLRVGVDTTEKPLKHFYVIKTTEENAVGFKVTIRKNSCMISFKGMYDKLQFKKSQNCRYELIDHEGVKGLKITLPVIE